MATYAIWNNKGGVAGIKDVAGKDVTVNQIQLDRQQPAIRALAGRIT